MKGFRNLPTDSSVVKLSKAKERKERGGNKRPSTPKVKTTFVDPAPTPTPVEQQQSKISWWTKLRLKIGKRETVKKLCDPQQSAANSGCPTKTAPKPEDKRQRNEKEKIVKQKETKKKNTKKKKKRLLNRLFEWLSKTFHTASTKDETHVIIVKKDHRADKTQVISSHGPPQKRDDSSQVAYPSKRPLTKVDSINGNKVKQAATINPGVLSKTRISTRKHIVHDRPTSTIQQEITKPGSKKHLECDRPTSTIQQEIKNPGSRKYFVRYRPTSTIQQEITNPGSRTYLVRYRATSTIQQEIKNPVSRTYLVRDRPTSTIQQEIKNPGGRKHIVHDRPTSTIQQEIKNPGSRKHLVRDRPTSTIQQGIKNPSSMKHIVRDSPMSTILQEITNPGFFSCLYSSMKHIVHYRPTSTIQQEIENLGFINTRNSCYINSCLQSLLTLSNFISHISLQEKVWIMAPDCKIIRSFMNLVRCHRSANATKKVEALQKLKYFISTYAGEFRDMEQKDAHEFLITLLWLIKRSCPKLEKHAASMGKTYTCPVEKYMEFSIINTRSCKKCGTQSENEEMFNSLCLALHLGASLEDLIQMYLKEFTLDYECECGSSQSSQQSTFKTLPKILILVLKRFKFTLCASQKQHCPIDFSSELLIPSVQGPSRYTLVSGICHYGVNVGSGHYNSFGLYTHSKPDAPCPQWLRYDDNIVNMVTSEQVHEELRMNAYIFFYQKTENT